MLDIKSAKTINYANVGFLLAAVVSLSAALALVTQWLQAGTRGPMLVSDVTELTPGVLSVRALDTECGHTEPEPSVQTLSVARAASLCPVRARAGQPSPGPLPALSSHWFY